MRHMEISPRARRTLAVLALLGLGALGGCVAYPAEPGYAYGYGGPAYYGYAPAYVSVGGGCCWGGGWHGGGWHDGGGWHGGGHEGGWSH
jgi:hypothetical protein